MSPLLLNERVCEREVDLCSLAPFREGKGRVPGCQSVSSEGVSSKGIWESLAVYLSDGLIARRSGTS